MAIKELFKKAKYISVPEAKRAAGDPGGGEGMRDYVACSKCEKKIFSEHYENLLKVCPFCGHHARLFAHERLACTADADTFEERYNNLSTRNPLEFEGYLETKGKLKLFRTEAIRVGFAKLWAEKNYKLIVETAERLPEKVIAEDDKLMMYVDLSTGRV